MTEQFEIANWRKYQHYKDRNPHWIKLHLDVLNSETWVMLSDASRLLAIVCMMLASRNDGKIPNNPSYIKKMAHLDCEIDLKPLIDIGFLIPCKQMLADASTLQADAIIEERREEERRGQKNIPAQLPPDWQYYAAQKGLTKAQIDFEFEKFTNHFFAEKKSYDDYFPKWKNWILNYRPAKPHSVKPIKKHDGLTTEERIAKVKAENGL